MRKRLSVRLLILTTAVVLGFCAIASAVSKMVSGDLLLYPVFAAAAFVGGLVGSRLSRRRRVVEGAIAAVACGVITAVANLAISDLAIVEVAPADSLGWVAGVGAVCLVGAVLGGRVGERVGPGAPGLWVITTAFTTAVIGLLVAMLLPLVLLGYLAGIQIMAVVEVIALFTLPAIAAAMVGICIDQRLSTAALLVGPLILSMPIAVIAIGSGAPVAAGLAPTIGLVFFFGFFGHLGRYAVRPLRDRLGPLDPNGPGLATATARESDG